MTGTSSLRTHLWTSIQRGSGCKFDGWILFSVKNYGLADLFKTSEQPIYSFFLLCYVFFLGPVTYTPENTVDCRYILSHVYLNFSKALTSLLAISSTDWLDTVMQVWQDQNKSYISQPFTKYNQQSGRKLSCYIIHNVRRCLSTKCDATNCLTFMSRQPQEKQTDPPSLVWHTRGFL